MYGQTHTIAQMILINSFVTIQCILPNVSFFLWGFFGPLRSKKVKIKQNLICQSAKIQVYFPKTALKKGGISK